MFGLLGRFQPYSVALSCPGIAPVRDTARDTTSLREVVEQKSHEIRVSLIPAEERNEAMPAEILRVSPLWLEWLAIAHEHASEAREHAGRPELGSREFRAAMVAVTSATFALDGLYGAVKRELNPPPSDAARQRKILELLKLGFQLGPKSHEWLSEFDWLYGLFRIRVILVALGIDPNDQNPSSTSTSSVIVPPLAKCSETSLPLVGSTTSTSAATPRSACATTRA